MRTLQLITLALFGVFAALTAFFQLRVGMKGGQAEREESQEASRAGEAYGRRARRCAVAAAAFLVLCMALGALNR